MIKRAFCVIVLMSCIIHLPESSAQNANQKRKAAIRVEEADADFPLQGEYNGKLGEDQVPYGIQVIALGSGKFRAIAYEGGLPGDGWNREKVIRAESQRNGNEVTFRAEAGTALLSKSGITISDPDGNVQGELKKVVRRSETLGAKPPKDATVLFDGSSPKKFKNGRMTDDGLLMEGTTSLDMFQSGHLHIEFQLSYMPFARGQGRSNSGVYLQGRYEVQVLDSFGLTGEHNECGGIYSVKKPDVNMCLPPLSWQTYDVEFTAAEFDDTGKKTANARMTVRHNGTVIHDNVEVDHRTTASPLAEGAEPGPLYLQNHSNPVRYRNIWFAPSDS